MKKVLFSGAAALLTVIGFSAFKPTGQIQYQFENLNKNTQSMTKSDYQYNVDGVCNSSPSNYCKAFWLQSTVPANGDHPSSTATFVSSGIITGAFVPSL